MSIYECSITNPKKQLEFYKDLSEQLQVENKQLKKQLEEYKDNYNCLLNQKKDFEYIMSKQVDYQGQQKEFIEYLENEIERLNKIDINKISNSSVITIKNMKSDFKEILSKYKKIIGGKE